MRTRVLLGTLIAVEIIWIAGAFTWHAASNPAFGLDHRWHVDAARRLLETGSPYWPWQVAGPYAIGDGAILYPPTAFALFIPFIWLPAVLWWAIPIGVTAYAMTRHRPPLWAWAIVASIIALEKSLNVYVFGNPTMWLVAAIAGGTVWGWPAVAVLAKPTFAPLALIGAGRRSWWIALAVFAAISVAFAGLWLDWVRVAVNSDVSPLYNLPTVPLVLMPLVPWLAGVRRPALRPIQATIGRNISGRLVNE